jgi:hypothetical protein
MQLCASEKDEGATHAPDDESPPRVSVPEWVGEIRLEQRRKIATRKQRQYREGNNSDCPSEVTIQHRRYDQPE